MSKTYILPNSLGKEKRELESFKYCNILEIINFQLKVNKFEYSIICFFCLLINSDL